MTNWMHINPPLKRGGLGINGNQSIAAVGFPGLVENDQIASLPSRLSWDGGLYQITGTAQRLGVPAQKLIVLHRRDRVSQWTLPVASTLSSAVDGSYGFYNIAYAYRGYVLIEFDDIWQPSLLNAAIADFVTPVLMPCWGG